MHVFHIVFYSSYYNRNNIAILSILLIHIALTLSVRNQILQYLLVCTKNGTIYNNIDITCLGKLLLSLIDAKIIYDFRSEISNIHKYIRDGSIKVYISI